MDSSPMSQRPTVLPLLSILLVSLIANVYLSRRVAVLASLRPLAETPIEPVKAGATLPKLIGFTLDGRSATLEYGHDLRPTVVYVFSPQCIWCARNLANIRHLVETRGAQYRFVGVATSDDELSEYVAKARLPIPIFTRASADSVHAYGLSSTPQTLVIDVSGKVIKAWLGAYVDATVTEVETFFETHLPGLVTDRTES